MRSFQRHGLWVMAGAGFLLLGVPKQAWAAVPELRQVPDLKQMVANLKKEPQGRAEQQQNRQNKEKGKAVLILPLFTCGQP